jgi:hypothetical protein
VSLSDLLYHLYKQIDSNVQPGTILTFQPAARRVIAAYADELAQRDSESTGVRSAWLGKHRGNTVRFAGVLHILHQNACDMPLTAPISESIAQKAVHLAEFFVSQFDILQPCIGAETDGVPDEVARLIAKANGNPVTPRMVIRWKILPRDATADDAKTFLIDCAAAGVGAILPPSRKDSLSWQLAPEVPL